MSLNVHGDDFTACGSTQNRKLLQRQFETTFEIIAKVLDFEAGQESEVRILNHVLR